MAEVQSLSAHLKVSISDSGSGVVERAGPYSICQVEGARLLIRGEIFSIPDEGPKLSSKEGGTAKYERILKFVEAGGQWQEIEGQFSAILVRGQTVTAYRSVFSAHLLYFSHLAISDRLLGLCGRNPKYSQEYLEKFVLDFPCLQSSSPLTPIEGIERLGPGASVEISRGEVPRQTFLPFKTFTPVDSETLTREDVAERTKEKLKEVLLWYLEKDKTVFAELSGGLDSSFVCSFLSALTDKPIQAHMFSFRKHPSHAFSENCAKVVAKEKNIDLTVIDAATVPLADLSKQQLPYQDEPSDTYWLGALFGPILKDRLDGNSQLYSGFGCDQLFMRGNEILRALYSRRQISKLWPMIKEVARTTERPTSNFLFQFLVSSLPQTTLAKLLDRTRGLKLNPFKIDELVPHIRRFARVEWMTAPGGKDPAAWLCELDTQGEALERRFFDRNVPHSHLSYLFAPWLVLGPYVESSGAEYAHPFCDSRMIEFAFREVPWKYIHDYANPYKHLLREAQKGIVPDEVRLRSHNDFSFDGYYYSFLAANRHFLHQLMVEATKEFSNWMDAKRAAISFEKMMLGSYESSELKLARLLAYLVWRTNFARYLK